MKTKYTIKTDADFLRTADETITIAGEITIRKAQMESELQAIRVKFTDLEEMQTECNARTAALDKYLRGAGVADRLFKPGKKFGESTCAKFGIRTSKPALALAEGSEEAELIERLQQLGKDEWLNVGSPKLNRAAILGAGLSDEELADLGLCIVVKDKFFIEPKK